jgi:hypothetical protein
LNTHFRTITLLLVHEDGEQKTHQKFECGPRRAQSPLYRTDSAIRTTMRAVLPMVLRRFETFRNWGRLLRRRYLPLKIAIIEPPVLFPAFPDSGSPLSTLDDDFVQTGNPNLSFPFQHRMNCRGIGEAG